MGHQSFSEKSQTRQVLQLVFDHLAEGSGVTLTQTNGILTISASGGGGGSPERVIEYQLSMPIGISIKAGGTQSIYPGLPYGIQLTSWRVRTQDASGSIVFDVRRVASDATPTASDSICGVGQEPYLSSEVARLETDLSGWISTTLNPDDRIAVYVDYSTIVGLRSAILVLYGTQI